MRILYRDSTWLLATFAASSYAILRRTGSPPGADLLIDGRANVASLRDDFDTFSENFPVELDDLGYPLDPRGGPAGFCDALWSAHQRTGRGARYVTADPSRSDCVG